MIRPIRNIAIIAHVDHGKTTLVDKLLHQAGSFAAHQNIAERVMDSNDIERERGITILAKNCAVDYEGVHINIVDTPGHADFGGEVERVLSMVDGVLLLVDAVEGPMPQTRFVTKKALELGLCPIVVINKIDRDGARPDKVVNFTFDLFDKLGATEDQLDFPVVYASALDGHATLELDQPKTDMRALFDIVLKHVPAPIGNADEPLQLQISALDYSSFVGRIGIGRVSRGTLKPKQEVMILAGDSTPKKARVNQIQGFRGIERVQLDEATVGDIVLVNGIDDLCIGATLADINQPEAMPMRLVDEPTLTMNFQVNTSPFAGKEGKFVTSRQVRERLEKELLTNVAMRFEDTDETDVFLVSGRGELHLTILLESMRREGYELTVGRPQVIEKEIDGVKCEPIELLTIDVDDSHVGAAMELLGLRGGEVQSLEQRGDRMHIECEIPARGLIGLRSHMLTATAGEAVMYHCFQKYAPMRTTIYRRSNGVLIATAPGSATTYSMLNISQRGVLFVEPQDVIYGGQIVGENSRDNDLEVNIVKGKAFSNVREANKEATTVLKASRDITLESALEYIQDDELVEITPDAIRVRKSELSETRRKQIARKNK